ncbi:MAG TPA: DUF2341 domain-containing protein [Bacteroidia bacterium]|nr:DUF2341 domain-containing protein [Bacteroidia bacterium]
MNFLRVSVLVVLTVFVLELRSQSAVCAYKYRKRITFNPAQVSGSSDLVDFPAFINIGSDNDLRSVGNSGHVESGSGYDIIFTADDGVTKLEHELQKYTATTGELLTWVRVPLLSTTYSTTIYMYYGNTAATADQSTKNTWKSSFKGVWHFDNDVFTDASVTGNNATNGGSSNLATAKIMGGRSFSGAGTNYVQVPLVGANGGSGNGSITLWGMVNTVEASTYFFGESTTQTGAGYANRVQIYVGDGAGNLYLGLGGNHSLQTNVQLLSTATWYHIGLCWATSGAGVGSYTILVNGVQRGTGAYSGFTAIHSFADLGNDGNASQRTEEITGNIDEVHVGNTNLGSGWIITEYNNQNSPSTFYSVSSEPKVWNGGNNTNYNSASNWLNNNAAGSGDDVILNNGTNQPTLQGNEQVNSVFIRTGATLSMSNRDLSVRSDITNCGTIAGNTGRVVLNGTTSFVKEQNLSGSGTYSLNNLTINNTFSASPTVVLGRSVTVFGALVLTSGVVYTSSSNLLALGTSATSTSGSATSYVSGPMTKTGSANFVFPVGKNGLWRRTALSALTATATFQAEYFDNNWVFVTPVNSPLNNVSTIEYWQVDRIAGSGNARLSLYWQNATASGINNCPDLTIARWNGSAWDERAATTVAGSSCAGAGTGTILTTVAVAAFSPFTFASKTSSLNILPVELTDFTARCNGAQVHLNWSTATEKNSDYFLPEKSGDGTQWTALGRMKAAGNSYAPRSYVFNDAYSGESLVYYRLRQVDANGAQKYSPVIIADCEKNSLDNEINIYPNPSGNEFTAEFYQGQGGAKTTIKIIDMVGKTCWQQIFTAAKGFNRRYIPHELSAGSYFVFISSENTNYKPRKLVVN